MKGASNRDPFIGELRKYYDYKGLVSEYQWYYEEKELTEHSKKTYFVLFINAWRAFWSQYCKYQFAPSEIAAEH